MESMNWMSKTEKKISKIDGRLREISGSITSLQDLVLTLKTVIETVMEREFEKEGLLQLSLKTNENMDEFLKGRDPECNIMVWCTRRVERATSMILRAFMEQGARSAMEQVKYHVEAATRHFKEIKCPDANCFGNAVKVFKTLQELIENSEEVSVKLAQDLYSPKEWSSSEEAREEEISSLLAPLSNAMRLRILKNLGKGRKNYARLERQIGIRGGHLQFHLNNLIEAGYVAREKPQGNYLITMKGLRALRFSCELRDALAPVT
jgi:DNA-binding transcriptional ArsR family regulator